MNGLVLVDANQITTDEFSATTLDAVTLNISGTVNLPVASILDSYLSGNVVLENATNTFTAQQTFTGGFVASSPQTIDFGTNAPIMSGANITGLSSGFMDLTTNQTVTTGTKTFNVAPVVPRLGMASATSTFVGNGIIATTAQNGCYVGNQAGRLQNASANFNTAVGAGALPSVTQSQQNTAIGYNALNLFGDNGSLANTACGAYALSNARGGSRNLGFGTAAGNGLTFNSSDNTAICSDTISNSSSAALFSYPNITGTNISNVSPFTSFLLDPARFDISGGTPRARMSIRYYNGAGARGAVQILTYNSATYTMTSVAAPNLGCASNSNFIFYGGTTIASHNYTGAGGTGTTFTIQAGLNGATTIVAGMIFVYFTNATTTAFATISSYNNTTGVFVLTTTITLVAGLITVEVATSERGTYVQNCVALGSGALQNFGSIQALPMIGNCAYGKNSLSGAGGGFDNSSYLSGSYNSGFGHQSGAWCTGQSEYNTFFGAFTDVLYPMSTVKRSTAIGYNSKVELSNLIVLGTATETTRMWAMDVRGLPDFKAGLTVSAGPINFFSNVRAVAASGDVFQAFKNSLVGNAGHVLINDLGNLLYYDTTASAVKWRLDTDGKLTIGNIDISGTLINQTTTAGSYIKSNSNTTGFFFANTNGDIGYTDSTAGIGNRWFINANGVARFISSSNSFKYWEFGGNLFRYWNLGGGGNSILMNGDTGAITSTGSVTTGTVTTTNLNVSGTVNSSGVTTTFGGDIDTGLFDIYTDVLDAAGYVVSNLGLDIQNSLNGVIEFSGGSQTIRVGVSTIADTTSDGIVMGNRSTTLGGAIVIGADSSMTTGGRGTGAVLVGQSCESLGSYSVNVGYNTQAGENSVALGRNASAASIGSISLGYNSSANANQGTSVGHGAQSAQSSTAIGYNSRANFVSSLAIGALVETTENNQIALGGTSNFCLFNGLYYPFETSFTTITATGNLPAAPYYGTYKLGSTGAIDITLPTITTGMAGITLCFRKITTPLTALVRITCSAGNTFLPLDSITSTAAGTFGNFILSGQVVGRLTVISSGQWAVTT
jgi:hypothetical protein